MAIPLQPEPGADDIAEIFAHLALAAGRAILDVRSRGIQARWKSDQSPVTEADEKAEEIILEGLGRLLPHTPVIAEECVSRGEVASPGDEFILVDPLDGTREFLAGHDDFTVNIALVRKGAPVAGAIYAPALGRIWLGGAAGFACDVQAIHALPARSAMTPLRTRPAPASGLKALISRSHPDARALAELARLAVAEREAMGSSLKFCVIAEGRADLYPRFGSTMEWDTAAGDAILRAAGGGCFAETGAPMTYGDRACGFRNAGFIAWGDPAAARLHRP